MASAQSIEILASDFSIIKDVRTYVLKGCTFWCCIFLLCWDPKAETDHEQRLDNFEKSSPYVIPLVLLGKSHMVGVDRRKKEVERISELIYCVAEDEMTRL